MQDLEAKCCCFIFSLKVKHEQQTTGNRRQKLCIWSHFYHQGNLWHPIHVHCLMALTVFRLGRLHSGCVFCCKRSFVLFVFLITCSTCISNHKANQWLKSIHTLRGCNKCWISVLLKKKSHVYSALFPNATHLIYLLPIESNLLPQTLDYDSVLCNFESIIKH